MSLNSKMGDRHEDDLQKLLGGRRTRGSGSQWRDQMDGRHNRWRERFAFAWDGKSTLAKSMSIPRKMWEKAREQAGGERPMLALRYYDTESLDIGEDLVALSLNDFVEVLEAANHEDPTRVFIWFNREAERDSSYPLGRWRETKVIVVHRGKVYQAQDVRIDHIYDGGLPKDEKFHTGIFVEDTELKDVEVYVDGTHRYTISRDHGLERSLIAPLHPEIPHFRDAE